MVLVSHRYKFIYLKNYKTASSSVEAFFGQFCVDPSIPYTFADNRYHTINTSYGILGSAIQMKYVYTDNIVRVSPSTIWVNHQSALDVKRELGENIFQQYTKFCVVRNPYDYMVSSYYWDKSLKKISSDFKTYCKTYDYCKKDKEEYCKIYDDEHCKSIPDYETSIEQYNRNNLHRIMIRQKPICDYYIRYENLKEDIMRLLEKLGITKYNIDNLPNHKSYSRPKGIHYREYYDEETRDIVFQLFKTEIDMFGYTF